ncbi:hypothetical protein KUH03_08245 [Sphingobacterium sp. E70]|uniref:hypothetical protein n=1 Tax=Sphingobacterium sp. E70 TaxID=2853439 RepID=UPI00211C4551|nr:hypothetical protein [Sphingobacterium sp. E70]ULT26806.1 hypothetical protein KUH03_08245 [Sphingobacterium sp. E70]
MGIIIGIGIVVVLVFGFVLYATIKTKSTVISQYSPYKEWMGRTVILDKETVLLTEKVKQFDDKNIPTCCWTACTPIGPIWLNVLNWATISWWKSFRQVQNFISRKPSSLLVVCQEILHLLFLERSATTEKLQNKLPMGNNGYRQVYGQGERLLAVPPSPLAVAGRHSLLRTARSAMVVIFLENKE